MSKPDKDMRRIEAKWSDVLLVCRKCGKKLGGGFGKKGGMPLEKALKGELKGKRAPRVLAVPCMDICPKGAVVVVKASDPRNIHLVPAGTGVDQVIATLSADPAPHQPAIGQRDRRQQHPAHKLHDSPAGEYAHDGPVRREADQRPDGEGQLQR